MNSIYIEKIVWIVFFMERKGYLKYILKERTGENVKAYIEK